MVLIHRKIVFHVQVGHLVNLHPVIKKFKKWQRKIWIYLRLNVKVKSNTYVKFYASQFE